MTVKTLFFEKRDGSFLYLWEERAQTDLTGE